MNALVVAVLCILAAGRTHVAALEKAGEVGILCQPCPTSNACSQLTATRKLQSHQILHQAYSAVGAMVCHDGKCVPEASEKKDSFCESLDSGAAALQELQAKVEEGRQEVNKRMELKQRAGRRLLTEFDVAGNALAKTTTTVQDAASFISDEGSDDSDGNRGSIPPGWSGSPPGWGGSPPGWGGSPPGWGGSPPGWGGSPPGWGGSPPGHGGSPPGWGGGGPSPGQKWQDYRRSPSPDRWGLDYVGGGGMNNWLQRSSFDDSANRPSLLQQQDDEVQSSYFHVPDDGTPKANVLAYGNGYVQLTGQTLRVIPHVQNLETCARHCDMDSSCTHWRRCAGGDCGSRLQECELMSGASNPATEAPAPSTSSRTVAPAVLQQLAPSVRYVDPTQSDLIMESGTKSPTEFPQSLYGCPYPAQPNGQVGACLPPPQCNCANGVCYGSC